MGQPNDIKTDVELLKKDFEQLSALIDRMDLMIEKLSEVSTGLNRILAVHDNRLSQQEEITKHIFELIEMRRRESVESTKELKDMFDKVTAELKKGIDNLEKWRYYLIGMAIASGFLLSKLPDIRALLS
jgi:hypothetical protein